MDKNESVFSKIRELGGVWLDNTLKKAKGEIQSDDYVYHMKEDPHAKAIETDRVYTEGSQGYYDRFNRLSFNQLRQLSYNDSIVSNVIKTYQNLVANYSKPNSSNISEPGFSIELKNYDEMLKQKIEELRQERGFGDGSEKDMLRSIQKDILREEEEVLSEVDKVAESGEKKYQAQAEESGIDLDVKQEEADAPLRKEAEKRLKEEIAIKTKKIMEIVQACGYAENRPFDSQRWNLDAYLRAFVRDSLSYDWVSTEVVRDKAGRLHHWIPVDAATIRYASEGLKYRGSLGSDIGLGGIFPISQGFDAKEEFEERQKEIALDPVKLEHDEYKYVQVIRGNIERAFTPEELKVGVRNANTDIYNNKYGISEIEMVAKIILSHIDSEEYNIKFFEQGFSAKGILHIKAPINRRKLAAVRIQWQHMIKGVKNSFQTPIFSGMDEVKWIKLSQDHNDIAFQNWMHYLIKLICGAFQIDPFEIGFGLKDEGGKSGGTFGDNTSEKLQHSKNKGFYPLMRFIEGFINKNLMPEIDDNYKFVFTGLFEEDLQQRQKSGGEMFKDGAITLNEFRQRIGLDPIKELDNIFGSKEVNEAIAASSLATYKATIKESILDLNKQVIAAKMENATLVDSIRQNKAISDELAGEGQEQLGEEEIKDESEAIEDAAKSVPMNDAKVDKIVDELFEEVEEKFQKSLTKDKE